MDKEENEEVREPRARGAERGHGARQAATVPPCGCARVEPPRASTADPHHPGAGPRARAPPSIAAWRPPARRVRGGGGATDHREGLQGLPRRCGLFAQQSTRATVPATLRARPPRRAPGRGLARTARRAPTLGLGASPRSRRAAGAQIGQWTATIVENCLKELSALNKPFKYVGARGHATGAARRAAPRRAAPRSPSHCAPDASRRARARRAQ